MEIGSQFLNTKIITPELPRNFILRDHLFTRLDEGRSKRLVVVYAPAGYGKSTLINSWLRSAQEKDPEFRASWLSLGSHDDDPAVFFSYFIKSLQTIDSSIGAWALSLMTVAEIQAENIITSLINDLGTVDHPCAVVLDDYHWISQPAIHKGIVYLVDHLPRNVQIIIISREAPPLPLYRMRIYGELAEFDMQDLKFSLAETRSFLKDFMGLILSDELTQNIQRKTEGWVAGLQIAALSIRNRIRFGSKKIDITTDLFDEKMTAHDFFYQEVFLRQPEETQQFFLKTSILDQFCGPLCDELLGIQNSVQILEHLKFSNSFLIQLGGSGEWYRYHPLFVHFLTAHISPQETASLQAKASQWHEKNGMLMEAMQYAFAAGDKSAAGRILVDLLPELINKGETALIQSWIYDLPQEIIFENAYLSTILGWMLYHVGKGIQAAPYLKAVERIDPQQISSRHRWFYLLVLEEIHNSKGNLEEALEYGHKGMEISKREGWDESSEHEVICETTRLMGRYKEAAVSFRENLQRCREQNNLLMEAFSILHLSGILYQQGDIDEALMMCEDFIGRLSHDDGVYHPISGYGFISMAQLHYERNQLDLCRQYLETGLQLLSATHMVKPLIHGRLLQAKISLLNEDHENTRRILAIVQDMAHDLNHVEYLVMTAAESAELELRMGNLSACERWLNSVHFNLKQIFVPLYEPLYFAHIRLLITSRNFVEAEKGLRRLEKFALDQNRIGSLIKIYALLAQCSHQTGNIPATRQYLEKAVQLAAPVGYYRSFLDLDADLAPLLPLVQEVSPIFVKTLVDEFPKTMGSSVPITSDFVIRFSERELEILRLVMENKSNKEIAASLFITVGTTKWYLNNTFKKMGVKNRKEAVDLLEKIFPNH